MSSAYGGDPDIFGELHRYNCRAINRTATLFVNLLLFCSGGIYATINIVPVNFLLFYRATATAPLSFPQVVSGKPVLINNLDTRFHGQSHRYNCRAMSSAYGGDPDIFGELHHDNCRAMSSAYGGDPDIFGELHHDNCRAINRTATLL